MKRSGYTFVINLLNYNEMPQNALQPKRMLTAFTTVEHKL